MKKQTFFFIATMIALLASSCTKSPKTGWEMRELKGHVQKVVSNEYEAILVDGVYEKGKWNSCTQTTFDEKGRLVMELTERENMASRYVYTYDHDSCKVCYYENGTLQYIKTTTFTSAGKEATIKTNYVGYGEISEVYTYNSKDQLTETHLYVKDRDSEYQKDYEYDKKGNLLSYTVYSKLHNFQPVHHLNQYDENNRMIRHEIINEEMSEYSGVWTFEYDEQGSMSYVTCKSERTYTTKYSYEYDEQGNFLVRLRSQETRNENGDVRTEATITERVLTYY